MSNRNKNSIFLSVVLIVVTLACNVQTVESPNLEATITAQALLLQQSSPTIPAEQVVVVVTATLDPSASTVEEAVVPAAVVEVTAPSGAVTVTVSAATNCRTGPGQNFSSVYGMPIGQVAEVVAKNTYSNYWIIKIPNGNGTTCWLWGQYATVTGNTGSLSEVVTPTSVATKKPTNTATLQPSATFTAALTKPTNPSNLTATKECSDLNDGTFLYSINLFWTDNSVNEAAYFMNVSTATQTVYETSMAANITSAWYKNIHPAGTALKFNIIAQNQAGSSDSISAVVTCP